MKKGHPTRPRLLHGIENDWRTIFRFSIISLVCHIAFFFSLVFIPNLKPSKPFTPSVINVSMVSLPEAPQVSGGASPEPKAGEISPPEPKPPEKKVEEKIPPPPKEKKPPEPKPEPVPEPVPKPVIETPPPKAEAVSIAPKKKKTYKPKKSLKKKTFKPAKVVKSAVKRMEKQVEVSRSKKIKSALDKIKRQVKTGQGQKRSAADGAAAPSTGAGLISGQASGGPITTDIEKIYQIKVQYDIQKNWAFSEQLAGNAANLKTVIVIKIMANGKIKDIWFERRSGNRYLDESAFRAVQKSDPLTPLPTAMKRAFYTLGIVFTPSGIL